jgi:hypothetical protein
VTNHSVAGMNRISLYVTAPPFMHVARLSEGLPPLGAILLADVAERPATSEELRSLFALAPWCPVCVLLKASSERRRLPRSPRMCSVGSLEEGGGGGAGCILAAVRDRPRPAPMELAEWLADRVRCPGLRAPLATLFGRAISPGARPVLGTTWSDPPLPPLGKWPGSVWQDVARLADLAANREAMGRLLARRNAASVQAIRTIEDLLGATEDEFRERAGWEWVLEAAIRRSREQSLGQVADVAVPATATRSGPVDVVRVPAGVTSDWPHPSHLGDVPRQHAAGAR